MASNLTIGVVQYSPEMTLEQNRDKFLRHIAQARRAGCRAVVFPEGALRPPDDTPRLAIDEAVQAIQQGAAANGIWVVMGMLYRQRDDEPLYNRLLVIADDGAIVHTYDKLWGDLRFPDAPGIFHIDGIACCATICADRWLRSVEELPVTLGAQILFECSNNFDNEWIADLPWYWYVPRALRNTAYVVFCNSSRYRPGAAFRGRYWPGHGHSAIIAPDGELLAVAGGETDRLLHASLDLSQATLSEASRRYSHPILGRFWQAGRSTLQGTIPTSPGHAPLSAEPVEVTIAAAQTACACEVGENLRRMREMIGQAQTASADVVCFPELVVTGAHDKEVAAASPDTLFAALAELQTMAASAHLTVVAGMPYIGSDGSRYNAAYAIGPDGALLTRYDQLVPDRPGLFAAGSSTRAMWFAVKGVPAVMTIGHDALWSEIAELAAVRGALLHFHLGYDQDVSERGTLRRRQLWANLASFRTLSATVNAAAADGAHGSRAQANGGSHHLG